MIRRWKQHVETIRRYIFDGKTTVWIDKCPPIQHRLHFEKQV